MKLFRILSVLFFLMVNCFCPKISLHLWENSQRSSC